MKRIFLILAALILALSPLLLREPAERKASSPAPLEEARHTRDGAARVGAVAASPLPAPRKARNVRQPAAAVASGTPSLAPTEVAALAAAERYVQEHRKAWGIRDYHELEPTVYLSPLGARVKYAVRQDGYPIVGLEISLRLDTAHRVQEVDNRYRPLERQIVNSDFLLDGESIVDALPGARFEPEPESTQHWSPVLFALPGSQRPEVAYVVTMREKVSARRRPVQLVVRATDGQIIGRSVSRVEFP